MDTRFKAGEKHIANLLTEKFRADFYDGVKEAYTIAGLLNFIKSVRDLKEIQKEDDEIVKQCAGMKITEQE